jgi:hypothetical protein
MKCRSFFRQCFALGREVFVAAQGAKRDSAAEARQSAGRPDDVPPARAEDPAIFARLILRRAGLAPLSVGIAAAAAAAITTPAAGQQSDGARVTALSQARAVILSNAVRVEQGGVSTRDAASADRTTTAPPQNISVSVRPCDTARRGIAADPVPMCVLRTTNLP